MFAIFAVVAAVFFPKMDGLFFPCCIYLLGLLQGSDVASWMIFFPSVSVSLLLLV
jgi:hypothetical protein